MAQTTHNPPTDRPAAIAVRPPGGGPDPNQWVRIRRTLLIGAGALALALGLLGLIVIAARPLALLLLAIVLGEALNPPANWLSRWMPRAAAVLLLYALLILGLGAVAWFTLAPLVEQARALVAQLPILVERIQDFIDREGATLEALPIADILLGQIQNVGAAVLGVPLALVSGLLDVVLVVILSIYWLLTAPRTMRFALSLFPPERREATHSFFSELGQTMGGYVRGVAINMVLIAVVIYIGLTLIGVEFALVLAVLSGLLEIVPILGPIIGGVIIVGFALLDSLTTAIITLVFVLIVQQFEGNVLTPFVMRSQTEIPPLLVLIALILGGSIGGLLGVLVAIPLAGAARVVMLRLVAPALRRWTGAPPPETQRAEAAEA